MNGTPLVMPVNMGDNVIVEEGIARVGPADVKRLGRHKLAPGDIVFGRRGDIGRRSIVRPNEAGWLCGTGCLAVKFGRDLAQVNPEWIAHFVGTSQARGWLIDNAVGGTMANLNTHILSALPLELPPKSEQDRVVHAIDEISGVEHKIIRLLAKKRAIKQGMMRSLLTGETRLAGFGNAWRRRRVSDILGPRSEVNRAGESLEVLSCTKHEGFVRSLDFFKNQVFSRDLTGYRIIHRGDIGYPANHVEEGSIGVQNLFDRALVSPIYVVMHPLGGDDTYFLQRQMKLESFRQRFARATNASVDRRGSLRWGEFSRIEVDLPDPDEQRAIATVLRDAESEIEALERRLDATRDIKQGIVQELLTGRTRLVPSEAPV